MDETDGVDNARLTPELAQERQARRDSCAENIRRLMLKRGWSQADLARASKVSPDRISKYIRGIYLPKITHVEQIARALGVTALDLMGSASARQKSGVVTVEITGDEAVLTVHQLRLRYPEALHLVEELRRLAARR